VRFRQRLVGMNRVARPAAPSTIETIATTRLICAPHAMHCGPSGVGGPVFAAQGIDVAGSSCLYRLENRSVASERL
jgi:hypothetical protein